MEITFKTALQAEDYCQSALLHEVRIDPESTIVFGGNPAPITHIGAFFPPYLKKVVFYLPDPPPDGAINAALWTAVYLGERYRNLSVSYRIKPLTSLKAVLADPHTQGPFTRVVVWGDHEGARLIPRGPNSKIPVLSLGDAVEAKKLFLNPIGMKTALFPEENAVFVRIESPDQVGPTKTLAELGFTPEPFAGMGTLAVAYDFALADLGGGVYPSGIHLTIPHAPTSKERAFLELALNGTVFKTQPLEGERTEFWSSLPKELLQRSNRLDLRVYYSPPSGECRLGDLPFSGTVDTHRSYFTLKQGTLLRGFDAYPQGFLPTFGVYLEEGTLAELQLAARLVQELQRTTKTPLRPEVVANVSHRPLLAVGSDVLARKLRAPVRTPGFLITDTNGRTWLKVEAKEPYSTLQALKDRVLLVSYTRGGQPLAETLLDELLKNDGWYGVHGDTAILAKGTPAVTFSLQKSALRVKTFERSVLEWIQQHRWLLLIPALILLILLLVWLYPRVVRPISKP